MPKFSAVLLANESSAAFWPKSRIGSPLALLQLPGGGSVLSQQLACLSECDISSVTVVTAPLWEGEIRKELEEAWGDRTPCSVVTEPARRGELSALCLALSQPGDRPGLVACLPPSFVPLDHVALGASLTQAAELCATGRGHLATLGTHAQYPEGLWAYARVRESRTGSDLGVAEYTAAPGRAVAAKLVAAGTWLWCSGALVFRVPTFLSYLKKNQSQMHGAFVAISGAAGTSFYRRVAAFEYAGLRATDLADTVFADLAGARSGALRCVEAPEGSWATLSDWRALAHCSGADAAGNLGLGPVMPYDCGECLFDSSGRLVVAVGLKNLVVVSTDDVTLVCSKERQADVGRALATLRANGMHRYL